MVRIEQIQESLKGLVGWKQPINPDFAIVDAENQNTLSGQYFQSISNLVTIENIKACQNYVGISDIQFNELLRGAVDGAVLKLMNSVFGDKDLIENKLLYNYTYDFTKPISNDVAFVGYEIDVVRQKDITNVINSISLTFNGVQDVKLLLFNSNNKQPVSEVTISTLENDQVSINTTWNMPFKGGKYYLGYLTSGLIHEALDRDYENSNIITCFNCSYFNPISVKGHDSEVLFDVNDITNESKTWGINLDVSSYKDYTTIVEANKDKFVYALQLQVANDMLDLMAHSVRSNRVELINYNSVLAELNGTLNNPNYPNVIGIVSKLTEEVKRLKEVFKPAVKITKETLR